MFRATAEQLLRDTRERCAMASRPNQEDSEPRPHTESGDRDPLLSTSKRGGWFLETWRYEKQREHMEGKTTPLKRTWSSMYGSSTSKEKNLLLCLIQGGKPSRLVRSLMGMLLGRGQGRVTWSGKKFGVSVRTSDAWRIIHEFNQSSEG